MTALSKLQLKQLWKAYFQPTSADFSNLIDSWADYNFTQGGASAVQRPVQSKLREIAFSVRDFGAVGDGTTDDLAAFNAALAAASGQNQCVVRVEGRCNYRLSGGIVIPENVTLAGDECFPGNPPTGTVLLFDNSVPTCVTLQGSAANKTNGLRRLVIQRAAGAPPAGSIGLRVNLTYNSFAEDVFVYNHAKGFAWDDSGTDGIGFRATRIFTGAISDAHLTFNRWPECVISDGRFGMSGSGDLGAETFIRLTGTPDGLGGAPGPNTLLFRNCIFIESGAGAKRFWQYQNMTMPIGDAVVYKITDCHIENVSTVLFESDAASLWFGRWSLVGNVFNCPGAAAFDIDQDTLIYQGHMASNQWFTDSFVINNTIKECSWVNNFFNSIVLLTGETGQGSTLTLNGNYYNGGLTLGGDWARLDVVGGIINGTLTDTAINSYITEVTGSLAWTPSLKIGGSSSGIAYTHRAGSYTRIGKTIIARFDIVLSSKGAATGAISIDGLPYPSAAYAAEPGGGGPPVYCENMAGLVSSPFPNVGATSSSIQIYQHQSTGVLFLSDSNITNTSRIAGQVIYSKE